MRIRNARQWAPQGAWTYAAALGAFALAFGLRYLMHGRFGRDVPFSTFIIATIVTEFFLGLGPALLVLALAVPVGAYFFIPPFARFDGLTGSDATILSAMLIVTSLAVALIELLRRAQYEARLMAEVAQSRYEMLLHADHAREVAERSARRGGQLVESIVACMPDVWHMSRPDGDFEYVSPRLADLAPADAVAAPPGQRLLRMLQPDDAAAIRAVFDELVATHGISRAVRFRLRAREGGYLDCDGVYLSSRDEHGTLVRLEQVTVGAPVNR